MDKLLKLKQIPAVRLAKPQPVLKFYNKQIYLVRTGKELPDNVLCFRTEQSVTKPEIRQYLKKLYGLEIKKVNTWNKMGKIQKTRIRSYYRDPDFKKVIVELQHPVPTHLQYFAY
jgi:ribosomal protein L23